MPRPFYRTYGVRSGAKSDRLLGKTHGEARLEAACLRAIQIKSVTYRSVASILKHALERQTPTQVQANLPPDHANVRGSKYYH